MSELLDGPGGLQASRHARKAAGWPCQLLLRAMHIDAAHLTSIKASRAPSALASGSILPAGPARRRDISRIYHACYMCYGAQLPCLRATRQPCMLERGRRRRIPEHSDWTVKFWKATDVSGNVASIFRVEQ
jgi:hypothetical protein